MGKERDSYGENMVLLERILQRLRKPLGGGAEGEGITSVFRYMEVCHYLGHFLGVLSDFWVPFWVIPGFLDIIIFGKNLILGY